MPEHTRLPLRLQVALHNYVNVEAPRKLCTKLDTSFASYFLPALWQGQEQPDGLFCASLR